jgi:hypothetical protein
MTAEEIIALIKLGQDLTPEAISLVKALMDKLKGATPEEVAAMAHALNATAISEIDVEIGKQKP